MLTKGIWDDFKWKMQMKNFYGRSIYNDEYMTWLLIGTIIFTPVAIALDILGFPIEIVYLLFYRVVEKMRERR